MVLLILDYRPNLFSQMLILIIMDAAKTQLRTKQKAFSSLKLYQNILFIPVNPNKLLAATFQGSSASIGVANRIESTTYHLQE